MVFVLRGKGFNINVDTSAYIIRIYLSVDLSIYLSIYLFMHMYVHIYIYKYVYLHAVATLEPLGVPTALFSRFRRIPSIRTALRGRKAAALLARCEATAVPVRAIAILVVWYKVYLCIYIYVWYIIYGI